jgi:hypothetical protein
VSPKGAGPVRRPDPHHARGLEAVIIDRPAFDSPEAEPRVTGEEDTEWPDFQLWRIIKARATAKLERLQDQAANGQHQADGARPNRYAR